MDGQQSHEKMFSIISHCYHIFSCDWITGILTLDGENEEWYFRKVCGNFLKFNIQLSYDLAFYFLVFTPNKWNFMLTEKPVHTFVLKMC